MFYQKPYQAYLQHLPHVCLACLLALPYCLLLHSGSMQKKTSMAHMGIGSRMLALF